MVIQVIDDGRGLDIQKIIDKAIEKQLIKTREEALRLTDSKIYEWIFLSGFTTAERITHISGRGVGLDIVKSVIEGMNGKIEIYSKKDIGTSFNLIFPINTAIIDGIIIAVDDDKYIIPFHSVIAFLHLDNVRFHNISDTKKLLNFRGEFIDYESLGTVLGLKPKSIDKIAIIVGNQTYKIAIGVPMILNQTQVVLKHVDEEFSNTKSIIGSAVLGDGSVALILNIDDIVNNIKMENI